MASPLGQSPSPAVWVAVAMLVCVVAVIPFGRRDDWLGWVAFLVAAVTLAFFWIMILRTMILAAIDWWRSGSQD